MKNILAWLFVHSILFLALASIAMIAFLADSIMEYFRVLDSFTGTARLFASTACGGIWGVLLLSAVFRVIGKGENEK